MKSVLAGIDDADVYIEDVGAFCQTCDRHIKLLGAGQKLWKKIVDAILRMDCPQNASKLCMFIGCVNYYWDMWPSCAHILKLLTDNLG
ncbi:hypothetical protein ACHAW6_011649 [Cyclotella cf. meneghiniana]